MFIFTTDFTDTTDMKMIHLYLIRVIGVIRGVSVLPNVGASLVDARL